MSRELEYLKKLLPADLNELAACGYAYDVQLNRDPLWDSGPCSATMAQRLLVRRKPWEMRAQLAFEYVLEMVNYIEENVDKVPRDVYEYPLKMFDNVAAKADGANTKMLNRVINRATRRVDVRETRINDLRLTLYGATAMDTVGMDR